LRLERKLDRSGCWQYHPAMHILFADESGTPPHPGQANQRYFVIGGIIVPESVWHSLRDALLGMKIRRKIRGELKWRFFSPSNDDARNPMKNLSQEERDQIRAEVYAIIIKEKAVKTIAAICSIQAAYNMPSINDQQDIYNIGYKTLTERFQYYLQDQSRSSGVRTLGLIICDHRGKGDDKSLRAHHQMLVHSTAAFTSQYGNLIESVLLQPSNLSIGIQLADMVAGAVWRKCERGDDRWYAMMRDSLRRGPAGQIEGYGIIKVPKANWV
jgi:hypothetical protein